MLARRDVAERFLREGGDDKNHHFVVCNMDDQPMKLPKLLPRFDPRCAWLAAAGLGDAGLLSLHAPHALG